MYLMLLRPTSTVFEMNPLGMAGSAAAGTAHSEAATAASAIVTSAVRVFIRTDSDGRPRIPLPVRRVRTVRKGCAPALRQEAQARRVGAKDSDHVLCDEKDTLWPESFAPTVIARTPQVFVDRNSHGAV